MKVNRTKQFIAWDDEEIQASYLVVCENGDFTIGEKYKNVFDCHICVRQKYVKEILKILNDPKTWEFENAVEDEDVEK